MQIDIKKVPRNREELIKEVVDLIKMSILLKRYVYHLIYISLLIIDEKIK